MTNNKVDLMALQQRQHQVEKELEWIKQQLVVLGAAASDSVREGTATDTTCDCAVAVIPQTAQRQQPAKNKQQSTRPNRTCGPIPYGSVEDAPNDASPLLGTGSSNKTSPEPASTPPDHIMLFGGTTSDQHHHEWEDCFSHVRSEEDLENEKVHNESEFYLHSTMFARAIPERLFALLVTLILEIPVLLMISGGSDALCMLIGRRRYQLLIGFLPLTSAISGNVGLQASTLTTRAISHLHVTADSYWHWLVTEIGAALYLGVGMGFFLGSIAFCAAGMDVSFGLTIAIAQLLSILTAGCTGTLAPLIFSFIFARDSGKWGGPLETAVQDIVGSFAMVYVSYQLLLVLGTGPIQADDVCGVS